MIKIIFDKILIFDKQHFDKDTILITRVRKCKLHREAGRAFQVTKALGAERVKARVGREEM